VFIAVDGVRNPEVIDQIRPFNRVNILFLSKFTKDIILLLNVLHYIPNYILKVICAILV